LGFVDAVGDVGGKLDDLYNLAVAIFHRIISGFQ
jgi:hypothetical protein